MDERRFHFDDHSDRPSRGYDSYYSDRNEKVNNFKLNIKDLDGSAEIQKSAYSNKGVDLNRSVQRQNTQRPSQQRQSETQSRARSSDPRASLQRPSQNRDVRNSSNQPVRRTRSDAVTSSRPEPTNRPAAGRTNPQAKNPSGRPNHQGAKQVQNRQKGTRRKISPERRKQIERERRKKKALIAVICILAIAISTTILSTVALATVNDILAIQKTDSDEVSVVIPEDADFDQVYKILCDNGLVQQKILVKLFCKFRHYDRYYSEKQGKYIYIQYKPGVYPFDKNTGIEAMLETIKGSNLTSKITSVTFPEGWTIAQIFKKLEKEGVCEAEKLYSNLDIVGKQYDFYNEINSTSGRYLKAEGYIFPDTYDFYIGENASSVLKKLFSNYQKKWIKAYNKQAKAIGMTQDEVITLASIIQREAKDVTQMADISSVLHNRLDSPETYPELQMNSTKEYITSLKDYDLFSDLYYSIYLESYNTYSCEGLPPGPICNPGIEAIYAALYPNDTDYYFFCHDANGKLYLASTAAEQQENYEKALLG